MARLRGAHALDDRGCRARRVQHERRDVDHRERVEAGVCGHDAHRVTQPSRGGVAAHVDGIRGAVAVRQQRAHRAPAGLAERRQREPRRVGRIGQQDRGPARVGDHAEPSARRDGLRGQQAGDVEQLAEAVGADHAGLGEERVDRGIGGRDKRAGV